MTTIDLDLLWTLALATAAITVVATEGSVANAFLIESDRARFGLMQSDVTATAVTGQGVFSDHGPMARLRAVASLAPEVVHVVLPAGSTVASLADLAGLRVAAGTPESGSRHTALRPLPIDAGRAARIAAEVHGLVPLSVPARTYPGQDAAVPTLAATALLVARSGITIPMHDGAWNFFERTAGPSQ